MLKAFVMGLAVLAWLEPAAPRERHESSNARPRVAEADADAPRVLQRVRRPNPARSVAQRPRIPPGASRVLHMDFARVRDSFLSRPFLELIPAIGDWSFVLDGSGVAPIDDLDRMMLIAQPRTYDYLATLAMVVRHRHDSAWVRDRAEALARLRDRTIEWRVEGGVPTARWYALDHERHPRIIAILGPHHAVVCRADDLQPILSFAGLGGRRRMSARTTESALDAVLSMNEREVLTVEFADIRSEAPPGSVSWPTQSRLAFAHAESGIAYEALGTFDSPAAATDASTAWRTLVRGYGSLTGFRSMIERAEFTSEGARMRIAGTMTEAEAGRLLDFLRTGFVEHRERQGLPPVQTPPP